MSPDPRHDPNRILREQQVKFTRAPPEKAATTCFRLFFLFCLIFMDFLIERNLTKSQHKLDDYVCLIQQLKAAAPLLLIELRTIPTSDDPPQWDGVIEFVGQIPMESTRNCMASSQSASPAVVVAED